MRQLDGEWMDLVPGHSIVAARNGDRLAGEQGPEDGNGLGQSFDSGGSGAEAQSGLIVFGLHVPGADA